MSDTGSSSGWDPAKIEVKPHAYDPDTQPELFEGVLSRRVLAFLIDVAIIALPVVLMYVFVFAFGLITLGLGWALFWLLPPITVIWALIYYGASFGGPSSATVGMRLVDLEMRTWYGSPCYFVLGAVHPIVFWITISVLTPFVLLVGLFNRRNRLLHDMLVGTVVINNVIRAEVLRRSGIF